ncbi:MAG: 6-carboxytetrahydropterin synthase [Flavobacteriales bacterium]|nr:6-carboxytetrahydropterin synthase [Flavobacteriales bacterium]
MIYITRKEHFNAAHKLWNESWSAEKNHEVFGKCANENWHGHNYYIHVTVKGEVDRETGYLMDLKILRDIIKERVTDKLDHKNLNLDVPFLKGVIPSTENVTIAIWDQIKNDIEKLGAILHCVKVYETENNYVEYYGE